MVSKNDAKNARVIIEIDPDVRTLLNAYAVLIGDPQYQVASELMLESLLVKITQIGDGSSFLWLIEDRISAESLASWQKMLGELASNE